MVFTKELLDQLPYWIFLYQEGNSHKKIARIHGVGSTTVYRYLKYFDIIDPKNTNTFRGRDLNPNWAGHKVLNRALHMWVRRNKPRVTVCEICHLRPSIDLANINPTPNSDTYTRDLENWMWLCRSCHMWKDGREKNLKQYA